VETGPASVLAEEAGRGKLTRGRVCFEDDWSFSAGPVEGKFGGKAIEELPAVLRGRGTGLCTVQNKLKQGRGGPSTANSSGAAWGD